MSPLIRNLPPPLTPPHRIPAPRFPEPPAAALTSLLSPSAPSAASSVPSRTPCPLLLLLLLTSAPPRCTCRYLSTRPRRLLLLLTSPLSPPAPWCLSGTPALPHLPSTPLCITLSLLLSSPPPSRLPRAPLWRLTPARLPSMPTCRRPPACSRSSRRPSSCSSFRPSAPHSFLGALQTICPSTPWFSCSDTENF